MFAIYKHFSKNTSPKCFKTSHYGFLIKIKVIKILLFSLFTFYDKKIVILLFWSFRMSLNIYFNNNSLFSYVFILITNRKNSRKNLTRNLIKITQKQRNKSSP